MSTLHLPASLARLIEAEGVRAHPHECCGILFGRDEDGCRIVTRARPTSNVADHAERSRRFSIEPLELMRAERDAAGAGELVIGYYHSHPDHPARPSDHDRALAWPFYSYVIVSIHAGDAVDLTSWVLDDETRAFRRQEIVGSH